MPRMPQTNNIGNIFLLFVLFIFFLIIYTLVDPKGYLYGNIEKFNSCVTNDDVTFGGINVNARQNDEKKVWFNDHGLIEPSKMEINQGIPIPQKYVPSVQERNNGLNPELPSVDGARNGDKSMYMFSYNKCKPECCIDSPYSCSGGCVCMTDKQYNFIGSRGDNHGPNGCTFEDSIF